MKEIPLTRDQVALVDDADYEWLMQWKWRAQSSKCHDGFYATHTIRLPDGRKLQEPMHRKILGLHSGDKHQGDHINHRTLDNRRENLRIVSKQENAFNRIGVKGYTKRYRRYAARIAIKDHQIYLGSFSNPVDAHNAYLHAKTEHHTIGMTRDG